MDNTSANLLQKIHTLETQNKDLQSRLEETEEALRAISTGEVDALVVYGDYGERIYTLQGADYAYRVMVESIHEGAANISADGTILYCNKRLAAMLEMPLEKMLGSSFHNYLLPTDQEGFSALAQKGFDSFGRAEFILSRYQGPAIPVLITASAAEVDGQRGICLVVTDLTEQKQAVAREKELQMRLMEQREEERVHIARNLHDGPLQDVISLSYTLQAMISTSEEEESDLLTIRASILKLAGELRSVCNELRPPSTIRFGLAKAIQYQSEEFQTKYPQLNIAFELAQDVQTISHDITTALYRIFQEAMNNIIRHANATDVKIKLVLDQNMVQMEVYDNGVGFHPPEDWIELARQGHLGLVGMLERAEAAGGKLQVISTIGGGTSVKVDVPNIMVLP